MHGELLSQFAARSPVGIARDVIDIGVVAYAVYRLLLLLRGTRAMQVGLGLGLVIAAYYVAEWAGLTTAYALLDRFIASLFLLVVVIFQTDIRRALMRVGNRPLLIRFRKAEETSAVEEVISSCALLAQRRIGALIVFEREAALEDFVAQGTVLDADVTRELLYSVFLPGYENPLHDGAVVIRNARVWKAGAFLPLTANPTLDRTLGTRHRAAIGISEETDAVVVIVSEERGQVSLCFNGNIVRGLDSASLRQALYGLFYSKRRAAALLRAHGRDAQTDHTRPPTPAIVGGGVHRASVPAPAPLRRHADEPSRERAALKPADERSASQRPPAPGAMPPRRDEPDADEGSAVKPGPRGAAKPGEVG